MFIKTLFQVPFDKIISEPAEAFVIAACNSVLFVTSCAFVVQIRKKTEIDKSMLSFIYKILNWLTNFYFVNIVNNI